MSAELAHFPLDPEYGRGVYRRRIRFTPDACGVVARLDDTHHSMWLALDHDGRQVTAIDCGYARAPTTACPGARTAMAALRGLSIDANARAVLARLPGNAACTHLADLACWALAHVDQSARWDITVPDERDRPVWIEIARNRQVVHRWQVRRHAIVTPERLAGAPLLRGFMRWAGAAFADEALMAAVMLQRGVFVARGRPYIVDRAPAVPLTAGPDRSGACYAYSGERRLTATHVVGYVRDFSAWVMTEDLPAPIVHRLQDAAA